MTKRTWYIASLASLTFCTAIWWFGFTADTEITGMQPGNAELVALGGAIYAQQCAACHGRNLEGQVPNWRDRLPDGSIPAPPHDPSGHTWHHPDSQLFEVTKLGREKASGGRFKSNMPGFEATLSDRKIWAVLSYIKSRWPAAIRQRHDDINRQAAAQKTR